ncbi:MAG: type II toxin-antitoxin system RelB/DinJ family antitoxin [Candidatus Magasanikbacteria bacterium]|nr:type II toxin-antitoxin system RelB/DinJ family antitoxin [Candidatus Magasanikbacteria bacterium]
MNSTVQLRVDAKTKRAVSTVFRNLGLDLSTGVKMYFQQVIRERGIPFPLITENGYTAEQEKKLLAIAKQTESDYRRGRRRTQTSVKAMVKEIMAS